MLRCLCRCFAVAACTLALVHILTRDLRTQFAELPKIQHRGLVGKKHYAVDTSGLSPEFASAFVQLALDDETGAFLDASRSRAMSSWGRWTLFLQETACMALVGRGWSGVDAQSFVRVSTMFVASQAQLKRLLDRAAAPQAQWLLDIGAGRGEPTSALAAALKIARADHVVALEASAPLRRELRWRRGYRGIAKLEEAAGSGPFDVVALLNVLDRVDDPERMLRAAARQLQPRGGLLVVASVLPFRGSVQLPPPANRDRHPRRPLELERVDGGPVRGRRRAARFGRNASRAIADGGGAASAEARFGRHAAAFVGAVLRQTSCCSDGPSELLAWTRLPYLSSASVAWTYSLLEHAIFVVRVAGKAPGASGPAQSRQINLRAASSSPITCERRAACANARGGGGRHGALASDAQVPLGGARRHG